MKQWMKKIGVVVIAITVCFAFVTVIPQYVYADSANVSIAVSNTSVKVGDSVTVTISVSSGSPLGSYSMAVTYNSSVLEYTGGSGNGGGGTVLIAGYGDGSATRLSATLNFRAIANGSSTVATSGGEAYGWDESILNISHAGVTVNVSTPAPSTSATTAPSTGENSSTEAPSTSSNVDTTLKSLEISPGTLEPAFQSTITNYTVSLPEDTTSIVISAVANNPNAKVTVSHNDDLEPGANKTYIVVTAEDGTQRTYVLNVNCGDVEEEDEPIEINGTAYAIAAEADMENVTIPEGYSKAEASYGEKTISLYQSANGLLQIIYLLNGAGEGQWFTYNAETQEFSPYIEFLAAENRYIILNAPEEVAIPEGYGAIEIEIQSVTVTAYEKTGNAEFVLVYATNLYNDAGFYEYDTVESTFQRFVEQEQTVEATTEEAVTEEVELVVSESVKVKRLKILLYIVCGAAVILFGMLIGIMWEVKKRFLTENISGEEDSSDQKPE